MRAGVWCLVGLVLAVGMPAVGVAQVIENLVARSITKLPVLEWTAPTAGSVGGALVDYEVRATDRPLDQASFDAADRVELFPVGPPRPAGVLELRQVLDPCSDDVRNGEELDVDCGGERCPPCPYLDCQDDDDCDARACVDGACAYVCAVDDDCDSRACVAGVCAPVAETCRDRQRNGGETDVDCGGDECPRCSNKRKCLDDGDCRSGRCDGGRCKPSTEPTEIETALYYGVRAVFEGGVGPVATADAFELRRLEVRTRKSGERRITVKGRFPVDREILGFPRTKDGPEVSPDVRLQLDQDGATRALLEVAGSDLERREKELRWKDGAERLTVGGNARRTKLVGRTLLDGALACGEPFAVTVIVGDRDFRWEAELDPDCDRGQIYP